MSPSPVHGHLCFSAAALAVRHRVVASRAECQVQRIYMMLTFTEATVREY